MEKFGLFDLIDKFNSVANGKKEFDKHSQAEQPPQEKKVGSRLTDPQLPPPSQYMMNAKMLAFCKRHDDFAKTVKRN